MKVEPWPHEWDWRSYKREPTEAALIVFISCEGLSNMAVCKPHRNLTMLEPGP